MRKIRFDLLFVLMAGVTLSTYGADRRMDELPALSAQPTNTALFLVFQNGTNYTVTYSRLLPTGLTNLLNNISNSLFAQFTNADGVVLFTAETFAGSLVNIASNNLTTALKAYADAGSASAMSYADIQDNNFYNTQLLFGSNYFQGYNLFMLTNYFNSGVRVNGGLYQGSGSGTITLVGGTISLAGDITSSAGIVTGGGGLKSNKNNGSAPTSISFPSSDATWANPNSFNIQVYINNSGVTLTAIKKNGTTIFTSGNATIDLQPGETISETYSAGSPSAVWSAL